jgi:hypothetical protein
MNTIEETKKKRFQFLHKLWELTGGDETKRFGMFEIGEELGFDEDSTVKIEQYLSGEELIIHRPGCGTHDREIGISHLGVRTVEGALSNPDRPTQYFPAVINITSIGTMTDSQLQIDSPGATQVATFNENRYGELKEVIQSLNELIDQLDIGQQQKFELQVDIQTIEAQMSSPKPKAAIITECIGSIERILEGVTSSALASSLLSKIVALSG